MGTPKRTSILLDLRTTLASVTVANGYKTDVVTVDDTPRELEDIPEAERPYIGWATGGPETHDHEAFNSGSWMIPIVLVGYLWVTKDDWANSSAAVNNFVDDLIAAISVDETRGGYAISTWIRGMDTSESWVDAGNDGFFYIDVEIEYGRTLESS